MPLKFSHQENKKTVKSVEKLYLLQSHVTGWHNYSKIPLILCFETSLEYFQAVKLSHRMQAGNLDSCASIVEEVCNKCKAQFSISHAKTSVRFDMKSYSMIILLQMYM